LLLLLLLFVDVLLLLLFAFVVSEELAAAAFVDEEEGWAAEEELAGAAAFVASPRSEVFGNEVEVSASDGGIWEVGVLFMQYRIVASQLFISDASLASITYSWLSPAFNTNVFSLSGISNGIVCRASEINAQKTPLRGCNKKLRMIKIILNFPSTFQLTFGALGGE
jgi:hypothetical protein